MSQVRVSVIIPARDAERFLAEAVGSIHEQEVGAVEIVVVDDGSTDHTAQLAEQLGARTIQTAPHGIAHARNRGLAAARGELIAFLDADDIWTRGSLRRRIDLLDHRPDVDFVYGQMREFKDEQRPPPAWLQIDDRTIPAGVLPTFLVRRAAAELTGSFDETLVLAEDLDWISRLQDTGHRGHWLDEVLVLRRRHADSITVRRAHLNANAIKTALWRSIRRKRASAR
jgi:glycosyltransferase involved in cell wall biosynthesis